MLGIWDATSWYTPSQNFTSRHIYPRTFHHHCGIKMPSLNRPVPSIAQTSFDHDLEARIPTAGHVVEGHHKPKLSNCIVLPPRAIHRTSRSSLAIEDSIDAIDAFFGVARSHSSRTKCSHHKSYVAGQEDAPPSYADATNSPPYASVAEPPTLAMYLFKFGFCTYLIDTILTRTFTHVVQSFVESFPVLLDSW